MKKVKKYTTILAMALSLNILSIPGVNATELGIENNQETNDDKVNNYFDDLKDSIEELINSDKLDEVKEKVKEYFITSVDFVFFDEPIKGVYFDDLKEEGKKLALLNIQSAVDLINEIAPDLMESLDEKYQTATLFIGEKYLDVLDKIKDYLGDENYQALTDIKNQIKDDIKSKISDLGNSLKKKYIDWKEK